MAEIKATRKFNTLYLTEEEYRLFNRYSLASYVSGKVKAAFQVFMEAEYPYDNTTSKLRELLLPFTATVGIDNIAYLKGCRPVEDFNATKEQFGITVNTITIDPSFIEIRLNNYSFTMTQNGYEMVLMVQNSDATKVGAWVMPRNGTAIWRITNYLGVKDEPLQFIQFLIINKAAVLNFDIEQRNFFSNV